jgi:hypothetical protein
MAQFAPGELFAPAWIKGNPQAEQAVNDWQQKYFAVNNDVVNASRAPATFGTGNAAGAVDYNALVAGAQGGLYDANARRNSIATQVAANQNQTAPASNPQYAAMRAQMSPADIQTFQQHVSPAEFAAFMGTTAGPTATAAGVTGAAGATAPSSPFIMIPTS